MRFCSFMALLFVLGGSLAYLLLVYCQPTRYEMRAELVPSLDMAFCGICMNDGQWHYG